MVKLTRGNLLDADVEAVVNTVNMESMATVHWVATREHAAQDPEAAYLAVQAWNTRKANMMRRKQVRVAWMRLRQLGWMDQPTSMEQCHHCHGFI